LSKAIAAVMPRPGVDDVRVLRLLDVDRDRRPAVDARDRFFFLLAVDDVRDLRQVDRRAALLGDDDPGELRRILDLALDADDRVRLPRVMRPAGHVLVRGADRVDHLVDADAERRHGIGLDLDQDLPRHAAADVDLGHPGDILERLDDRLVGERGQVAQRHRGREHGERHHRLLIFLVGAKDERILDVLRGSSAGTCPILSRTSSSPSSCRRHPELGEHLALAFLRVRPDEARAGNGVDRVFEAASSRRSRRLGIRPGYAGQHQHETAG
jgi:hypothetical protein